jgi:hypothetical protein
MKKLIHLKIRTIFVATAIAAMPLVASPAMAATAVQSFSGGALFGFNSGGETVGFTFSTSDDLLVTQLGWYAPNGTLVSSRPVGIWNSGGTLLGSTTVSAGAPDGTGFRYATTTPISLFAGQQYFIGGRDTQADGDGYISSVSGLVMGPSITFRGSARNSGSGFTFPNVIDATTTNGRFGANFQYTVQSGAVPEPAAWALMIGGFGLAGAMLRRRRVVASSLAR